MEQNAKNNVDKTFRRCYSITRIVPPERFERSDRMIQYNLEVILLEQTNLNPSIHNTPFLSIRNCVNVTGVSERMLRRMLNAGELPHIKNGTRVLVNVQQLLDILNEKTVTNN